MTPSRGFRNCLKTLPRRLQPAFRLEAGTIFVFFSDGLHLRMIRRGDASILVNVVVADLQIAASHFGRDMHQVGKIFATPAIAHMKMKTAPVVMLDEVSIRRIGTLVRFKDRGRMHSAVKSTDFVSRFVQVLGNELVEPSQRFRFRATVELFNVPLFDINPDLLLKRTRHANVACPYHADLIDDANAFCIPRRIDDQTPSGNGQ